MHLCSVDAAFNHAECLFFASHMAQLFNRSIDDSHTSLHFASYKFHFPILYFLLQASLHLLQNYLLHSWLSSLRWKVAAQQLVSTAVTILSLRNTVCRTLERRRGRSPLRSRIGYRDDPENEPGRRIENRDYGPDERPFRRKREDPDDSSRGRSYWTPPRAEDGRCYRPRERRRRSMKAQDPGFADFID
jgi:hypothetical protein